MNNVKTFSIPSKNIFLEQDNGSQFLKGKFFAISEGDNLNKSNFDIFGIEKCISENDYTYKPILGAWDKEKPSDVGIGNFGGHDSDMDYDTMSGELYNTYLGEKNERPLGLILPNTAKIEQFKGKRWLAFEGLIWVEYNREAIRLLKKRRTNNVSVEIRVLESYIDERGIEIIKRFTLLGITIIGVDAGIPDAHINLVDFSSSQQFSNFVRVFSNKISDLDEVKLEFLKQEEYGTGEALQLDLSKDSSSNDAWGPVNKTKLRNDLLKAKNYKSIIPKSYLVTMDGWEDAPSEKLKYPIVQIKEGKVVLNINGVQSAGAYLMKERDADYFLKAKAKLNKIRRILEMDKLMALIFGVETNEDLCEDVSQNQPSIIKMEGGNIANMERKEIVSKLSQAFADKIKFEEELKNLNAVFEEKMGDYEYAEEDEKESFKVEVDDYKDKIGKKEEEIKFCAKSIIDFSNELISFEDDDKDKSDEDNEEYPDDEDKKQKFVGKLEEGCHYVSTSKNYIVYEKEGELYACKYACGDEGELKMEDAQKVEKIYATFITGGPLSTEDSAAMPKVNVEITKGFSNTFAELKTKDVKIAEVVELEKQANDKVKFAEEDKEKFKVDARSMLSKFEELTCSENVSKEFKNEIYSKIFDSSFSNIEELETKVKASLYEFSKSKFLSGSFLKNIDTQASSFNEQEQIDQIIKDYKK